MSAHDEIAPEVLRRGALDALGPHGDLRARDALEQGALSIEHRVTSWEASVGTVHGHRVTLEVPAPLKDEVERSPFAVDALHAAIAAAVARQGMEHSLAELRLVAGEGRSPWTRGYRD